MKQPAFDDMFTRETSTSPTFNAPEARAARDEAIDRVVEHADGDFIDQAIIAIGRVAATREEFIVDEVWKEIDPSAQTHEKRAMGAAMQMAKKGGLIAPTDRFSPSEQVQCHANPRRVWRSLVYRP